MEFKKENGKVFCVTVHENKDEVTSNSIESSIATLELDKIKIDDQIQTLKKNLLIVRNLENEA